MERNIAEDDLLSITEVPAGLDLNEWHALTTIGFFEHINLLYGTVSEFCTLSTCPEMVAPGPRFYLWHDEKGKKSRLSAPQYVDYVMTYVQKTVNDESIFPTKHGNEFPNNFDQVLRKVQKLLFHVVAHIYHSHFREIVLLGLHAHLNSLFAHIIEYNLCYHTIEDKEIEVLQDLVLALKLAPDKSGSVTSCSSDENKENQAENCDRLPSIRAVGEESGASLICDERISIGAGSENCVDISDTDGTSAALSNSEDWSISN